MRDNCIRKKRGPKGRKWLEEKGLISDRKKEHEGENGRERRAHLPPAVRYMLTLSLCVNTHCMCACWYRSVNPSLASYLIAVPCRLFKNLHVSLAWSLLFSSYSNFHIATLNLKKRPGKIKFSSFVTSCSNLFGNKISQITFTTVWTITKYCLVWSWHLLYFMFLFLPLSAIFPFVSFVFYVFFFSCIISVHILCLPIYEPSSPPIPSAFSLLSVFPLSRRPTFCHWPPAPGVWALTGSLRVTGAPCQYLPGLATLCAVVRESGREGDTRDAPQHREIK